MAPPSTANPARRRRTRRSRQPHQTLASRDRQPVGTVSTPFQTINVTQVTTVSRPLDDTKGSDPDSEASEPPFYNNPSQLGDRYPGLDPHHNGSLHAEHPDRPSTFADMHRALLIPQRDLQPGHMASHEPVPLHHYIKFKKRRRRAGGGGEIDDGTESDVNCPSTFARDNEDDLEQHATNEDKLGKQAGGGNTLSLPNSVAFGPSAHLTDALSQHFALVKQTFGRELPSATHLRSTDGQRDGEVRFTIDGGGDIRAHAWSAVQFQWLDVGGFSYRRNAIEGALGVRQLKGQKIGSVMPRNQIELFAALAKQFEEENSFMAISPAAFDTTSNHNQKVPQPTIPLLSPHLRRPVDHYAAGAAFSTSFGLGERGAQQSAPRDMDRFAPAMSWLHCTMTRTSDSQALHLTGPQPAATIVESGHLSPINLHGTSPLGIRFPLDRTIVADAETASLERNSSTDTSEPFQPYTWRRGQSPNLIGDRPGNISRDRQHQFRQSNSLGNVHGSLLGTKQGAGSYADPITPYNHEFALLLDGSTSSATVDSYRTNQHHDVSAVVDESNWPETLNQAATISRVREHEGSQDGVQRKRLIEERGPDFASTRPQDRPTTGLESSYSSIASIGYSEPDFEWGERKVRIWNLTRNGCSSAPHDQDNLDSMAARRRGPFFTASNGRPGDAPFDGDFQDRQEMLYKGLEAVRDVRTSFMRMKAKTLHDHEGAPLSDAKVEELASDPLSHVMWAVKFNLNAYKEIPASRGDNFHQAFTRARPEYIENSIAGDSGFFKASHPSSDEVVLFKGRRSQPSPALPATSSRASSQANVPGL